MFIYASTISKDGLKQLMIRKHGEEFWLSVLKQAEIEAGTENLINIHYPDSQTFKIVHSISDLSKIPIENIWEIYGQFFVEYGFLNNLDSLHYFIDHVVFKTNMRGPSFRCEENSDGTITVHYLSSRSSLYPIVKGVLREIAKRIYGLEIGLEMTGRTQRTVQLAVGERVEEHVIFQIKMIGNQVETQVTPQISDEWSLKINTVDFASMMPFHLILDRDCKLIQSGIGLRLCAGLQSGDLLGFRRHIPADLLVEGTPLTRIFEIHRPQIPLDYENICQFINGVFILQSRSSPLALQSSSRNSHASLQSNQMEFSHLKLKGQMLLIDSGDLVVYLASPYVTNIDELQQFGLKLSDFAPHDATRDLCLLNQQRLADNKDNRQLEKLTVEMEELKKELDGTKERTHEYLSEFLPTHILEKIELNQEVETREYDVTVIYAEITDFDEVVEFCTAVETLEVLSELFQRFDRLCHLHEITKIEDVGDSYVVVAGFNPTEDPHAETALHIALGLEWKARLITNPVKNEPLLVRCGIDSGRVMAGVIQSSLFVFGQVLESALSIARSTDPGRIRVSEEAKSAAELTARFEFELPKTVQITDGRKMETHSLKRSFKKSIWEIVNRQRDENVNSIDGYTELNQILESQKEAKKSTFCSIL
ncbi:Guanylate cyclase [Aphelenchoides besseyi]|nr:Guanylate cyclase [Aphelenchoides besseyi]KAI6193071.1 Guanylate cyclase [Aphelenchoides besseyi]